MIVTAEDNYKCLDDWVAGKSRAFVVCGNSFKCLSELRHKLEELSIAKVYFSDFQPNPLYESVVKGVKLFRKSDCDCIIAVGGGSAIDVAKCIRLFSFFPGEGWDGSWLNNKDVNATSMDCLKKSRPDHVPFLVIPTTAGTGSEATRFAVIYYKGIKQSVTDESFIPNTILMDPGVLRTLPIYQKKATMCDALSHAVESFWSVNSTKESKEYSKKAIKGILENMEGYLNNTDSGNHGMLYAAYVAGKAINISRTTAGHAMCYKLTTLFGIAHGHATILCNRVLFQWMIDNIDKCNDPRGSEYLKNTLEELGKALGCANAKSGAVKLNKIFESLKLDIPKANQTQIEELINGVNMDRLVNFPIILTREDIGSLYHMILTA